ncbi:class I adenylate-forming enzyme family protein [Azospirillum sp. BE72]|uniref:class I adenylate-forming enzyme family protein n=1 Tax=Azospirillum sp. BE72 TaxID=2817776 RepID=UPI002858459D|nr:class I adenylate-forming enzyme family protein [Azospirillum sp. BE72]MDR6774843.1 acyl-CoA synthetase (AMP-forming)/AMP-acid ligase II [Azospirillum sp. BE72]
MTVPPPDRIDGLLRLRAAERPRSVLLVTGERSTTYAEADRAADRIAAWLQGRGVTAGDRVVLYAENGTEFLLAVFGILRAGAAVVPIHPRTPPAGVCRILDLAEPAMILTDGRPLDGVAPPETMRRAALVDLMSLPDAVPRPAAAGPACIIFTSGSTGGARGVVCGHREILFAIKAINRMLGQTADDRIFCCLPFSFDYGLYQSFLAVEAGASLIVESTQVNPLAIPSLLQHHRATGFPLVPSLATALLRSRMLERMTVGTVRYVSNTGDMLPRRHAARLSGLLGAAVMPMYGLTECKRVSVMPPSRFADKPGSVGLPLPGTQVTLRSAPEWAGLGTDAGELLVRGPHVMDGYWRDPDATARRFRACPASGQTVLHTDDLFRRDAEGFLYFLGRDETLIRRDGGVISPVDIEQRLSDLDKVAEAVVIGRGAASEQTAEAFIVTDGAEDAIRKQAADILAETAGSAPGCASIHFLRKLPRTLNGKIDRRALLLQAGRTP